jgi:hypothetical protein
LQRSWVGAGLPGYNAKSVLQAMAIQGRSAVHFADSERAKPKFQSRWMRPELELENESDGRLQNSCLMCVESRGISM